MEVLQRTANRGSISTGPYQIDNSLKLEADNNERMQRASNTIGTPTNAKIATLSFWAKRTELISNNAHFSFIANAGANSTFICFEQDKARVYTTGGNSLMSNALFRDTSAWYHFVAAFDMTQGTASNRVKIYINGVQITSFQTETYGTQNNDIGLYDVNMSHYIGYAGSQGFNGYITELNLIDGQQLAPTEFGETDEDSGIWKPKAYDGTYGNEGYYLDMSNASNLGEDQSGNDNDFGSLYGITAADQATDTPTNNFCTLNILDQRIDTPTVTTEGATVNVQDPGSGTGQLRGTMGASSGKWYWEVELDAFEGSSMYYLYGISSLDLSAESSTYTGSNDGGYSVGIYGQNGNVYYNDNATSFETNGPGADGDLIGVFLDLDNGTLRFSKNGTLIGNVSGTDAIARSSASLTGKNFWTASFSDGTGSTALRTLFKTNFGGYTTISISSAQNDSNGYGTFEYTPNDGTYDYYALCTKNLAEYG